MASSSGQTKQDFKVCEDEKHDLECPICLFLVKEAVELNCSHLLCTECAQKLSLSAKKTRLPLCCPICKENFTMSKIHRSAYADRLVRNLNVYCPQRTQGCIWKGTTSTYHLNHLAVCQQFPIHCLNEGCKEVIPRIEMNQHVENECQFTIIQCTFYSLGCHQMFERRKQEDHNQKSTTYHMTLMFKQSRALENEVTLLKTENQTQNEKIEKQKTEIDRQTAEIEKLKTDLTHIVNIEKQKKEVEQLKKGIGHFETKSKVATAKKDSRKSSKLSSYPAVEITELLLNGAERWIRKKKIDENDYAVWFQKIFDLLVENRLYRYDDVMCAKIRIKKGKRVSWASNSTKNQEEKSKEKGVIHKGKDGLLLRHGDDWSCIHTETLDDFNYNNSSCMIIHPHEQQKIMHMEKPEHCNGFDLWKRYDVPGDFYVYNFLIFYLIKN